MSRFSQIAMRLKGRSVNARIFRAAAAVTMAGALVKIVAMAKEIVTASIYGRSDAMDAFLIAALIPNLLINLLSDSMNQALVPTLVRVREQQGQRRAQELLSSAMLWLALLLAAASLAMALAARGFFPLIASHFGPDKLTLSIRLFYGLLPVVLLTGIAGNCTAVLNTLDRFALPALGPMAISVAVMAGALGWSARLGIWAMVYGMLVGTFIHAALMAWLMNRHGYRFSLRWYGMTDAAREVGRQYGPVLLSGVVASSGLVVDQSMAATLTAGSVSALVYGNRFVSVVLTLLAGAVATAVTPYFSRMIAYHDWTGCKRTVRIWAWITAVASVPFTLALMICARPLVRLTLQHGAFGQGDTEIVTRVLIMYAVQIPFFVCSRVFYRMIIALRRTDLVFYCGAINLVLDVVLNLVLMRWFGVAGIALATSLWTVSTFAFLWYWSSRLLNKASEA